MRKLALIVMVLVVISACSEDKQNKSTSTSAQTGSPPAKQQSAPEVAPAQAPAPDPAQTQQASQTPAAPENPPMQTEAPKAAESQTANSEPAPASPKTDALELARRSGCLACHKVETKVVGPAWKDVAKRYAGDVNARQTLITKVKKGGGGNWKEITGGVAMPPYSPRVPDAKIGQLVDFILSLK